MHRSIFLGTPFPNTNLILIGLAVGLAGLVGGIFFFNRAQGTLVDTL
jgi:ABC-type polysaccharide/polyol phosphate export permease